MKAMDAFAPEVVVPLVGLTVSHVAEGVPTVQFRPSPPVLVRTTVCAAGLVPAVVVKVMLVVLSCIAGAATVIVTGMVFGLPICLPVVLSKAVMVTLVLYVEPPARPVASTVIFSV